MKKNIFLFIFSFFLLIMLASCRRTWVIEIDGYILHEINEKYHIAQIPQEVANQDYYEVPAYIGEYEIYGFGSNRVYGMWGGEEHLELGNIRKLKINSNIHSLYFDHFSPLLIETERPLSEMYINIELFLTYFLSPKEDLEYFDYVDAFDSISRICL